MKSFKTIDEQIKYLKDGKNVIFNNLDEAKDALLNNNYYNLVSCAKIKFVSGIDNNRHTYDKSNFSDWYNYYLEDIKVSKYLMKLIIDFEKKINSRTAYYIGMIIEKDDGVPNKIKNEITEIIKNSKVKNLPEYSRKETWKYITKMEFGKMKQLIFYLNKNRNNKMLDEYLNKIISSTGLDKAKIKTQMDELNNLRNHLFHFTPLNIYISYGRKSKEKLSNRKRKDAINLVLKTSNNANEEIKTIINDFFNKSDKFIKIKNS